MASSTVPVMRLSISSGPISVDPLRWTMYPASFLFGWTRSATPVEVDDVPRVVLVRVDAVGDAALREDRVRAAARDGVDGRFDVDEPLHCTQCQPVVHRYDEVAPRCPDAGETVGFPCSHVV